MTDRTDKTNTQQNDKLEDDPTPALPRRERIEARLEWLADFIEALAEHNWPARVALLWAMCWAEAAVRGWLVRECRKRGITLVSTPLSVDLFGDSRFAALLIAQRFRALAALVARLAETDLPPFDAVAWRRAINAALRQAEHAAFVANRAGRLVCADATALRSTATAEKWNSS